MIAGYIGFTVPTSIKSHLQTIYHHQGSFLITFLSYSITILSFILYPLCGFMADICCGRYWTVTLSLSFMALGTLVRSISSLLAGVYEHYQSDNNPVMTALDVISYLTCMIGVAGFDANVIQFGLDQLMEHNSRYLSLYLHWLVWLQYLRRNNHYCYPHSCSK